jgi:hypothetical protein
MLLSAPFSFSLRKAKQLVAQTAHSVVCGFSSSSNCRKLDKSVGSALRDLQDRIDIPFDQWRSFLERNPFSKPIQIPNRRKGLTMLC